MASSLQHGLSPSVRGNLSDVIDSLPEDKELHEQGLVLQFSSSTDLVEDRSFPESLHDHDMSSFVCLLGEEKAVASGGEFSHTSFLPCQQSQPKQLSSKEQQLHKHPRSSLHRSVELEEAKAQELTHVLSSVCVYDLPDLAWTNPVCVFRGHLSKSQLTAKKSGQMMTNKLAAQQGARHSELQVVTGTESLTALSTVVSCRAFSFFWGG